MQQGDMKTIVDNYIKSYNSFDINGMLASMHQDILFQNISNEQVNMATKGIEELRTAAELARTLFKSRCQKVTNYQFLEKAVIVDIDYKGLLAADIPNGPKAGECLILKGRSEFKFEDGLVIELTDHTLTGLAGNQ
ncbi:MAG: nuclear transport factor 2 family protein [Deltaproteobacteria bacterium]|nr:nuclear transport factor 2 family protein [Deltaproteobacteria bacterium]